MASPYERKIAGIYLWNDSFGACSTRILSNVLFGCEMASSYLWNDSFGGNSLEDHEYLCYWALRWTVFICGETLSARIRYRTTNTYVIGP